MQLMVPQPGSGMVTVPWSSTVPIVEMPMLAMGSPSEDPVRWIEVLMCSHSFPAWFVKRIGHLAVPYCATFGVKITDKIFVSKNTNSDVKSWRRG